MVGTTLGHFRIAERLGSGGMGDVYAADDLKLGRRVALKVLPSQFANDSDRRERFEREARAIAALNHPNIVTIHSVEDVGGVHFLTMELVQGRTLADILSSGRLSLDRLLKVAVPIADAISAAHQRGITHRDLKPANIMVADDGRVKVLDFGLAKLKEDAALLAGGASLATGLTGEGRIVGTVAYMSPEQAEAKPIDHRTDLFALGVILYEMATGHRPFKGDSTVSLISSIIKDSPAPITTINPSLPRDLSRIVRRALAKDPDERYQDARDLRNDLRDLQQALDSGELAAPAIAGARLAMGASKWRTALFVGLPALALAGAIAMWLRPRSSAAPDAVVTATFSQLTSQPGIESFPSLSPDGQWFVYVSSLAGNPDIYLQSVGGQNAINLTRDSPVDDTQPAFSPDGQQIAFRSARQGGGIFVMGRTGEFARRVAEAGFNPAWSFDGKQLAYSTESIDNPYGREGVGELWLADVATGNKRRVFDGDAVQPAWSPNGRWLAYWAVAGDGSQRDLWTIPAAGGRPIAVTQDASLEWSPLWSPDGRFLYFVSDRGGSLNLWRVTISQETGRTLGDPQPVTTPAAYVGHLAMSRDATRVVYSAFEVTSNLQRVEFDSSAGVVKGTPAPITGGSVYRSWVDVSPDGTWVVYVGVIAQEDIFISKVDGTETRQLTNDRARDRNPRWSPDGRQITFYSDRSGLYQHWTMNGDGSDLRPLTDGPEEHFYPIWAPDGSRIVSSNSRTFALTLFDPKVPWKNQRVEVLIPPNAPDRFEALSWSPDGRMLAGRRSGPGGVAVYSMVDRKLQIVTATGNRPRWLDDNRTLVYVDQGGLSMVDIVTKATRALIPRSSELIRDFAISRDSRQLVLARGRDDADVWLATLK